MAAPAQARVRGEALAAERAGVGPSPLLTGAAFLVTDLVCLIVATASGFALWGLVRSGVPAPWGLAPGLALFPLVYAIFGLYPGIGMTPPEELRRIVGATSVVFLVLTASMFMAKNAAVQSRGVFFVGWMLTLALVPLGRASVCHLLSGARWWGAPAVVLGAGKTSRLVIRSLAQRRALGLTPVACLDDDPAKMGECESVPVVGSLALAPELAARLRIRHAILAMPGVSRQRLLPLLEQCSAVFPNVILIPNLFGISSLWVEARDLGGVLGLQLRYNLLVPVNRWIKRVMDVTVSLVGGLLALPVIGVAIAWIKLASPGPAFFVQEREGEGGAPIRVWKLRTMYPDAERRLNRLLAASAEARAEWSRFFKLKNDPRVLPVIGKLLRKTSLDELPQLWNVLKGEMSLVGPRPFPEYHNRQFPAEFRKLRCKVKPGLTGMWQVSERSDGDLKVQEQLDTYYIRNWSIWLDIYVLGRTVRAVLAPNGAY